MAHSDKPKEHVKQKATGESSADGTETAAYKAGPGYRQKPGYGQQKQHGYEPEPEIPMTASLRVTLCAA